MRGGAGWLAGGMLGNEVFIIGLRGDMRVCYERGFTEAVLGKGF